MSNLFNLTKLLTESTSPEIVQSITTQTYLSGGVDLIREMNASASDAVGQMYISLAEADSAKSENEVFGSYFKEYKEIISKYILKAKELMGQFTINVETFADANKDIIDIADGASIVGPLTYKGVHYVKLLDANVPCIDPNKAFKKEFAFIGKLMQDLGPCVADDVKAQVIASVCNNLAGEISDDWLGKCIKKIADVDECSKDGFARTMYNVFVKDPSSEMTIDIGLVKQCKLSISNYITYINSVQKSVNDFCEGLESVANYIGSMFYRNQDHRVEIHTDVEGVEDKTYRLGNCSMNQMNQFIATKISQITELCNLYIIAITIKMDCIYKYLQQCKNIIDTAYTRVDNIAIDKSEEGDTGDTELDCCENIDYDDPDDFEFDDPSLDSDAPIENSNDTIGDDNSSDELEMECYLFEAEVYQKERLIIDLMLKEQIMDIISEDTASSAKSRFQGATKSAQAIIQNLIARFGGVVEKFKTTFANYDKQVGYIKNNQDRIMRANIPQGWTIQPLHTDKILNFTVQPFNPAESELLSNKDQYLKTKYGDLIGENDGSIKDRILQKILEKNERPYTDADRKDGVNFILNQYSKCINNIENANRVIQNAKTKVGSTTTTVTKESVLDLEQTMLMYFNEDATPNNNPASAETKQKSEGTQQTSQSSQQNNSQQKDNTSGGKDTPQPDNKQLTSENALRAYLTINTNMVTAVMNIYNMAMKKHLNFLKTLAKLNGAAPLNDDNKQ